MTPLMRSQDDDSLFKFPCEFPIKAIGRRIDNLDAIVFSIVRRHAPDLSEAAIRSKPSRQGNYLSLTVTLVATSRAQLDAIYTDLTACEHIMMVL
ncbi:MAG TPA: DUF493 domain-containing protein [Gammaproteobacteria bacterium]